MPNARFDPAVPLHKAGIGSLLQGMLSGQVTAATVVQASLDRIADVDDKLNAFISIDAEGALAQAESVDARRGKGEEVGSLGGIPLGIKDIIGTAGHPTTCGSRILAPFRPVFDATAVARLRQAGAVILGKTNLDEFAMGSSTEHSSHGATRNPWDLNRVPGGSSGGSASAVAARQVPGALGTDTGGSVRQPASFTGTVGLKPTYGRVSRYGLIAFASSLDQVGTLTRNVGDGARLLQVMAGADPSDMTSSPRPAGNYLEAASRGVRGMKIGLPREYYPDGLDDEVAAALERCKAALESSGAELVDISLPHTGYAIAAYYILATAEASSNLARYDGVRYGSRQGDDESLLSMYLATRGAGFGDEVKRRIMLGTYVLSAGYFDAYYMKAQKVRALIRRDFQEAFKGCQVLLVPTTPTTAFKVGEKLDDPLSMYLSDIFTVTANLAGVPGISVPCGFSAEGLPIGCQFLGNFFDEESLFAAAHVIEASAGDEEASREPSFA